MNRDARVHLAQETIRILQTGTYVSASGRVVNIGAEVKTSAASARVIRPDEWDAIISSARAIPRNGVGKIEVTPETTLAALQRMTLMENHATVSALNFASAKNPGGGFLGGSQAQEESLARSSGLYATLVDEATYYETNRKCGSLLYTDHAIASPLVPVFRDDSGALLDQPYVVNFITMPAANVGAMSFNSLDRRRVEEVMRRRIDCVLAFAAVGGSRHIVLGAWGCGVFRNDPEMIARLFAESLSGPHSWRSHFDCIVFAVFDPKEPAVNRPPFEAQLSKL
jgi:uncharacterized protein (TIGR02452 family)